MKVSLRIAAKFNTDVSTQFGVPGLQVATIVDDNGGFIHDVTIEYAITDEEQLYRRLNYKIISLHTGKTTLTAQNEMAEQLLYTFATVLAGATMGDRHFEKGMFILPRGEVWDDVLPTDKKTRKRKPQNDTKEVVE